MQVALTLFYNIYIIIGNSLWGEGELLLNKVGIKVFVNALTIFRCIFTFAMPFLMDRITDGVFLTMIIALYFTDWLDGFISRKCKVQTLFGSMMDTLADKILCIVLIFCIKGIHWVLYAMLIGEVIIGAMNLLGTVNGAALVAIFVGKVKMWALALATLAGYMYYFKICGPIFVMIPGIVVLIMQVIVIFGYGRKMTKNEIKNEKAKFKRGKELAYALFDTDYYLSTMDQSILQKLTVN